ncbi:MAG TPA: aconitate hydratase [Pyrinomonadaceae bacterium]|nr:aconitate hydratase [Pyrinomonadaceae bacterium]HMP65742.1 aconitate hydratase [Pyrinomonadaceae bacterium]
MHHDLFNTLQSFKTGDGSEGNLYSLPKLEDAGLGPISRLPLSIRIVLESVLRNYDDGRKVSESSIRQLAGWKPNEERTSEIPFVVARVVLQDFTGVPLLVDLAAMRSAVERIGRDVSIIEPLVPVDLVIDHSVQVDYAGSEAAYQRNIEMEFRRNEQRYRFLKWGTQAFNGFRVVPPGIGIVHQVNLEYLAKGVFERNGVYFPDTLVGTDSHTTMINGLGIVGWGVGGIEAEAGMLGQPVYFLTPDVVGVHLSGELPSGATATDLVLRITEMLREAKVVGKFVEFFGEGASKLNATDRATIANMAPEYGATIGFFGVDEKTLDYFAATGRSKEEISTIRSYFEAQDMYGIPQAGDVDYSVVYELDLASIVPSVAGPKRPQDRIAMAELSEKFRELFAASVSDGGYGKPAEDLSRRFGVTLCGPPADEPVGGGDQSSRNLPILGDVEANDGVSVGGEVEMVNNRPTPNPVPASVDCPPAQTTIGHGDVLIAAITSCTNTSNPSVMLAAGIVAKKASERGLKVPVYVKTSLAPGSRVVTEYLEKTGLQRYLDDIGFNLVGYGCTTCIGNSGPLDAGIESEVVDNDIVAASVLSGNRNFEARVHQNIKANFLMSPPLVVAYALAGSVLADPTTEPIGIDANGSNVFLKDLWPTSDEIKDVLESAFDPETYRRLYANFAEQNPLWNQIEFTAGKVYTWDSASTYIQEPPYFKDFSMEVGAFSDFKNARALAIFGDSVTTDHISPAGAIKGSSPAGQYLQELGVETRDFNSYGSRRGNDRVMIRGTFANVRIKNQMVAPTEGGFTRYQPDGEEMTIYEASVRYQEEGTPLIIFAGKEYGTGSSRDWAAKGTRLMGVKAVIAESFERIHRSNLVGMGVLPLQFKDGDSVGSLRLKGDETFEIAGLERGEVRPMQDVELRIIDKDGAERGVPVTLRIDTPIEIEYYISGGILPFVLRQLLSENEDVASA